MDGEYEFGLRSTGQTKLTIDGKSVVTNDGDNWATWTKTGTVRLPAGSRSFSVSYSGRQKGGILEAFWTPPGGRSCLIPPEAFGPLRTTP